MSKITNYSTLVENIIAVSEDNGTEFAEYIPTAIALAEERLIKEVDIEYLVIEEIDIISGQRLINKPTGYRAPRGVILKDASDIETDLIKTTDSFLRDYWPNPSTENPPKYYADYDQDRFIIAPTSDDAYTVLVKFIKSPDPLSTSNATNFFIEKLPDTLFAAAMVQMMIFSRNYTQKDKWESEYINSIGGINNQGRRERRDDNRTPGNPEGGQNTLKGTV